MAGGEEVGRGRLAGEEDAAVDGDGQRRAVVGVAGQGVRIGAGGERVVRPARP